MDITTVNEEAINEQTKLYRAAFEKDPRFICIINNGASYSGMPWIADSLALATATIDYPGCFNGMIRGLGETLCTPSRYARAIFPNTTIVIAEFNPAILESNSVDIMQVGSCICTFDDCDTPTNCLVFDNLVLIEKHMAPEHMADLIRSLYIEAVRTNLHSKDKPLQEIRFDFPLSKDLVKQHTRLIDMIPELKMKESVFSLSKVIMNEDSEDRFAEDYNPFDIKIMRLLPTDAFTMPQSILDTLKEMRIHMLKSIADSGAIPPASGAFKKAVRAVDDTYARRLLFTHFTHGSMHCLIFFKDGEPIGFLDYENTPDKKIHLHTIFIREQHRNKGYGSWIMRQFFAEVFLMPKSLPVVDLEIFNTTNEATDALIHFYGKHGFQLSGMVINLVLEKDKFIKLADALV